MALEANIWSTHICNIEWKYPQIEAGSHVQSIGFVITPFLRYPERVQLAFGKSRLSWILNITFSRCHLRKFGSKKVASLAGFRRKSIASALYWTKTLEADYMVNSKCIMRI